MKRTLTSVLPSKIPEAKRDVKARLPILSNAEVRRFRIPHHEAVILELRESDDTEAANYLQFLFDLDQQIRNEAGPDTATWYRPKLSENRQLIAQLRKVLVHFCNSEIPITERTLKLIKTTLEFESYGWDWWWVADALFQCCLWIVKEITNDHQRIEAAVSYLYSSFLLNKIKDAENALRYVEQSQAICRGKTWIISEIIEGSKESLYQECCRLRHKCLLNIAGHLKQRDAKAATKLYKTALDAAVAAGQEDNVAEALNEIGKIEQVLSEEKNAILHLSQCLETSKMIGDPGKICDAHLQLAQVYRAIGEYKIAEIHLYQSRDVATIHNLPEKLAQSEYCIGENCLQENDSKKAATKFESAFLTFQKLEKRNDANKARFLTGISKGLQLLSSYQNLMLDIIQRNNEPLLQLLLWKANLQPFQVGNLEIYNQNEGELMHSDDCQSRHETMMVDYD